MLGLLFYEMIVGTNPFAAVGSHLRGDNEANRRELRQLHLQARQRESFGALDAHVEMRRRPGVTQVIRQALMADMGTRPYHDADEFHEAWRAAWRAPEADRSPERPWEAVRRLTGEAEQCLAVGDTPGAMVLLQQAVTLNTDPGKVPDCQVVGRTYLLYVQQLLRRGDVEEAGKLAVQGYRRRMCRSTCAAMADYYARVNPDVAQRYGDETRVCKDPE
jgi:hypothetical protein